MDEGMMSLSTPSTFVIRGTAVYNMPCVQAVETEVIVFNRI